LTSGQTSTQNRQSRKHPRIEYVPSPIALTTDSDRTERAVISSRAFLPLSRSVCDRSDGDHSQRTNTSHRSRPLHASVHLAPCSTRVCPRTTTSRPCSSRISRWRFRRCSRVGQGVRGRSNQLWISLSHSVTEAGGLHRERIFNTGHSQIRNIGSPSLIKFDPMSSVSLKPPKEKHEEGRENNLQH
jgi:hypothetical protein